MQSTKRSGILVEKNSIPSAFLQREVKIDFYLPEHLPGNATIDLLLINDGQNMEEMGLHTLLAQLFDERSIQPLLIAGIHAGVERKQEYGIAAQIDYLGRGSKAKAYTLFVLKELLPFIYHKYPNLSISQKA